MAKRNRSTLQPYVLNGPELALVEKKVSRRRTTAYLERTSNHESVMETCRFFEENLAKDVAPLSLHCSRRLMESAHTAQKTLAVLRERRREFEMEHRRYLAQLRNDAYAAIQVTNGFKTFSSVGRSEDSSPRLRVLDIGDETACALKQKISDYAGVPSDSDLKDWSILYRMLR